MDRIADGLTKLVQRVSLSEHRGAQGARDESAFGGFFDQEHQFGHGAIRPSPEGLSNDPPNQRQLVYKVDSDGGHADDMFGWEDA
jgi:hypothetical protein